MNSPRQETIRNARARARKVKGVVGLGLTVAVVLLALVAPWVSSADPNVLDLSVRLRPPVWTGKGMSQHVLGTDQLGRDLWSRIAYGTRISLLVSVCTVLLAGSVGIVLGLVAGYYGGTWDRVINGLVNIQMAFPFLLLAIAIVSAMGPSVRNVVFALALYGWVVYCRLVRGQVLALRDKDFIQAATALGCHDARILRLHILPNVFPALLVISTFQIGQMIVAESAMGFLGLGVQPPTPTWGGIINEGRAYVSSAWWVSTLPGVMLMITVIGIGFAGDWLREVLDPSLQR